MSWTERVGASDLVLEWGRWLLRGVGPQGPHDWPMKPRMLWTLRGGQGHSGTRRCTYDEAVVWAAEKATQTTEERRQLEPELFSSWDKVRRSWEAHWNERHGLWEVAQGSEDPNARYIPKFRVGWVYAVEATGTGKIKLGHTTRTPEQRLAQLRCQSPVPLVLVAAFEGGRAAERAAHAAFKDLRTHGEWFADTPEVRAYYEEMLKS